MSRRVLLFGPTSVHLRRWRQLAEEQGFEIVLVSFGHRDPDSVMHVPAHPDGIAARVWWLGVSALRLRRLIRRARPDLVHAHWIAGPAWIAAVAGGAPLVASAWGSDALRWTPRSRFAVGLARLIGARAAAITYDADVVADALVRFGVRRDRLVRIVFGADTAVFRPVGRDTQLLERLGVPDGTDVILSARGLEAVYRPETVLEAFALVRRRRPATLLVRVAERQDTLLEPLLTAAADAGVADHVVVYRDIPAGELPALLASVDVAVSVPGSDGTSVLLLECLACETPVVVSDLPANREWVPADSGWLVPVGDARRLADALQRVLDDPAGSRAVAAAAAHRVRAEGSTARQAADIATLYARTANGSAPREAGGEGDVRA